MVVIIKSSRVYAVRFAGISFNNIIEGQTREISLRREEREGVFEENEEFDFPKSTVWGDLFLRSSRVKAVCWVIIRLAPCIVCMHADMRENHDRLLILGILSGLNTEHAMGDFFKKNIIIKGSKNSHRYGEALNVERRSCWCA